MATAHTHNYQFIISVLSTPRPNWGDIAFVTGNTGYRGSGDRRYVSYPSGIWGSAPAIGKGSGERNELPSTSKRNLVLSEVNF